MKIKGMINRFIFLGMTMCCLFCLVCPWADALETSGTAGQAPGGVSGAWWSRVREDIVRSEYNITWQKETGIKDAPSAWQAPNRANNIRTYFLKDGIMVTPRDRAKAQWTWGVSLTGYGTEEGQKALGTVDPAVEKNRVTYDRGQVKEWYINNEDGVEQGFTILSPPAASNADLSLSVLAMKVTGDLLPGLNSSGDVLEFRTTGGVSVIRMAKLMVRDAKDRVLASSYRLRDKGFDMVIDTAGAEYPIKVDPIIESTEWTAEPDQAYAYFGTSVASAGDVNGDGYSDVIVGASSYDNGETNEGIAFVYLGSSSGLGDSAAWTAEPDQEGASFGGSVASAGDVNGDGYSDVIVGASTYDNGETDEGRAFVYLGSASGLGTSAAWTAEPDQASAYFGTSVAPAGDVNDDGYSDVIVGASSYDNGEPDEGRAFVYLGSSSGLAASAAWTAESDYNYTYFGGSVAPAGDVNGDGYSDVIIGAYQYSNGETYEGRAFVYHGSASGLGTSAAWTGESDQQNAIFGWSVASAGDVNNDGYADVIVGSRLYNNGESSEGMAFVYHGSASGLGTSAAWTAESNQASAYFGTSVASAGDVNGDGYSDVIVGAARYDNGETDEGRVFVYLGSASGLETSAAWAVESDQASAYFGTSVASAGDVNGDGYSDIIVGAYSYSNGETDEGKAFVYYGSPMGIGDSVDWTGTSGKTSASYGYSVASAGDVNGDGYEDVIVGAPFYSVTNQEGKVCLYQGAATGLSTSAAWTWEGSQEEEWFGFAVASAGDVNGDGYSDVMISAMGYDATGITNAGRIYVYHGSASGLSNSTDWTVESGDSDCGFGWSVAGAGDVNGDGYSDILVSEYSKGNGESSEGMIFAYHGSSSGLSGAAAWSVESNQASAYLGWSVASAGDVNGDGYSDIIAGAPRYDNGQTDEGRAFVYLGSASGLSGTAAWTGESDQATSYFGTSVASAGDVNGDGYSDVIVGAPEYTTTTGDEGQAFVYLGSASGLSGTAAWTGTSGQAAARFGYSVASAGDIDADGYSDIIVGAPYYDDGETDEGMAYIYLGSASGPSASADWTAESDQASSQFGYSVASAGDVNGDGSSDVIIGAPYYNVMVGDEGRAFAYYGKAIQKDDGTVDDDEGTDDGDDGTIDDGTDDGSTDDDSTDDGTTDDAEETSSTSSSKSKGGGGGGCFITAAAYGSDRESDVILWDGLLSGIGNRTAVLFIVVPAISLCTLCMIMLKGRLRRGGSMVN